jgi:FkbM family methyltransferase
LYASTVVGPAGRVFAFEPAPNNIVNIKKHLAMNHLANVSVVEGAVSNVDGVSHFDFGISAVAGHLATDGGIVVRTITLDHEIDCGALPEPDYIKIDAEGAELSILEGARNMLARRHPTLSVETHQWMPQFANVRQDCIEFLSKLGYTLAAPDPADADSDTHLCAPASALAS